MAKLPSCSGEEAIRVFEGFGYQRSRQRGSHVFLECEGRKSISVPLHRELKSGVLRALIRDSGLSVEEFAEAL